MRQRNEENPIKTSLLTQLLYGQMECDPNGGLLGANVKYKPRSYSSQEVRELGCFYTKSCQLLVESSSWKGINFLALPASLGGKADSHGKREPLSKDVDF